MSNKEEIKERIKQHIRSGVLKTEGIRKLSKEFKYTKLNELNELWIEAKAEMLGTNLKKNESDEGDGSIEMLKICLKKDKSSIETFMKINSAIADKINKEQNEVITEKATELVKYVLECVGINAVEQR